MTYDLQLKFITQKFGQNMIFVISLLLLIDDLLWFIDENRKL